MFKDISLYIDNNKVDFEYEINKDKVIIKTIDELEIGKNLKIFYDENIYEIKLNNSTKFSKGKAGEIFINLDIKKLSFSVILKNNLFETKLASSMQQLIEELDKLNVLEEGLLKNEKGRSLSLFGKDLDKVEEYYGNVYSTLYKGSFAQVAQAQRHRTIDYQIEMLDKKEYFVPPIILDDQTLVNEWLNDMEYVKDVNPQGEIVKVSEMGKYEDFVLKCKERLCSEAQLEIMLQTKENLIKYKKELEKSNNPLALNIEKYSHGARCTFPDFCCAEDCKIKEGKTLIRKI